MLILGINASPFTNVEEHNCAKMLYTALYAAAATGAAVYTINLDQIPHDDGRRDEEKYDLRKRISMLPKKEGNLRWIVEMILKADGVIFCTPTRNFTASSRILALLSWLQITTDAPDYALAGKVAAFMAGCEEDGGQSAIEKMMSPCVHMGFIIPPFANYFFNKFAQESEGDWQTTDRTLTGLNVRRMIQILNGEISGKRTAEDWNDSDIGSW
jgi:multimeric flavodoxin WrbA